MTLTMASCREVQQQLMQHWPGYKAPAQRPFSPGTDAMMLADACSWSWSAAFDQCLSKAHTQDIGISHKLMIANVQLAQLSYAAGVLTSQVLCTPQPDCSARS